MYQDYLDEFELSPTAIAQLNTKSKRSLLAASSIDSSNDFQSDAEYLWDLLFRELKGLLCITSAKRGPANSSEKSRLIGWKDEFFRYPIQAVEAANYALQQANESRDVFFVVCLLSGESRKAEFALPMRAVFCDFDSESQFSTEVPSPTAIVMSSPGKYHQYWALNRTVSPQEAQDLSKRLAYHLGADKSGWDATQLLRVPGTRNFKYIECPMVRLQEINDERSIDPNVIKLRLPSQKVSHHMPIQNGNIRLPVSLSESSLRILSGEDLARKPDGTVDRSRTLYKIAATLSNAQVPFELIVDIVAERDLALATAGVFHEPKYATRGDALYQYGEIASKVEASGLWDIDITSRCEAYFSKEYLVEGITDTSVATMVAASVGSDTRYCPEINSWYIWDGRRWKKQSNSRIVEQQIVSVAQRLQEWIDHAGDQLLRDKLMKQALTYESNAKIRHVIERLKAVESLCVSPSQFDNKPYLFNVLNGTVNLKTGELLSHRRDDFLTLLASVPFDAAATAPRWEEFLNTTFQRDIATMQFVQRVIGYSLIGEVRERAFFMFYGSGRNGKSVFMETVRKIFGSYASPLETEALMYQQNPRHPADFAQLDRKRLAYAQEMAEGRRLNVQLVKKFTGGDSVTVRGMHQNPWEMTPQFKLFLVTNSKPAIEDISTSIWDRIKLISFPHQVEKQEQVELPELVRRFAVDEGAGVLNWALAGCRQYLKDGLNEPRSMREEIDSYRSDVDILGTFLDECCDISPRKWVKSAELYAMYCEWCSANGEPIITSMSLGNKLRERGFKRDTKTIDGASHKVRNGLQPKTPA